GGAQPRWSGKLPRPPAAPDAVTGGGGGGGAAGGRPAPPAIFPVGAGAGGGGGGGAAPPLDACFVPAPDAQIVPSAATAIAVTSRFGIWYSTNPSPACEIRTINPPGSVPTIKLPLPSSAIERTCASSVRKKTFPFPSGATL